MHLLQVVPAGAQCGFQGPLLQRRPAADRQGLAEILQAEARIRRGGSLPGQQASQRHRSRGATCFIEGHRSLPQKGKTTSTGVTLGVVGGDS
jgi:hypothetical protein